MTGANGMNSVRLSRWLSQSLIPGSFAWHSTERLPSARGPYSMAPSKRATTFPRTSSSATAGASSAGRRTVSPDCSASALAMSPES